MGTSELEPELDRVLRRVGLGAYAPRFAAEKVADMETVTLLTTDDLRDLGLKIGERAKLRHELRRRRDVSSDDNMPVSSSRKRQRPSQSSGSGADVQNGNMKAAHEDTASNGKSAVDHSWIFNGAKPVAAAPREEEDLGEVDAEDEPDGYEIERGVRIVVANEVCGRSRGKRGNFGKTDKRAV
eukprot:scaffold2249_cov272-Pinguiococcus_pyrenoidosus.AAC.1